MIKKSTVGGTGNGSKLSRVEVGVNKKPFRNGSEQENRVSRQKQEGEGTAREANLRIRPENIRDEVWQSVFSLIY